MSLPALDESTVDELYRWLQAVPLSRQIRNLPRDMSDGVMVAELVAHFLPRYVSLSNFTSVNSAALKRYNWETLNKIVFSHLNYQVTPNVIQKVVSGQPGAIEYVLFGLRHKLELAIQQAGSQLSLANGDSLNDLTNMTSSIGIDADCTNSAIRAAAGQQFGRVAAVDQLPSPSTPTRPRPPSATGKDPRDEQIEQLTNRMRHLERLVQLKDVRITELSRQLDKYKEFAYRIQNGSPATEPQHGARVQPNGNRISTDSDSSILQETNILLSNYEAK